MGNERENLGNGDLARMFAIRRRRLGTKGLVPTLVAIASKESLISIRRRMNHGRGQQGCAPESLDSPEVAYFTTHVRARSPFPRFSLALSFPINLRKAACARASGL
jgi:hypothetical protein